MKDLNEDSLEEAIKEIEKQGEFFNTYLNKKPTKAIIHQGWFDLFEKKGYTRDEIYQVIVDLVNDSKGIKNE
jgi:hypothetical protein